MADLSDVENQLTSAVILALYPTGTTGPSAVGSVCRIYRGWPLPDGLNSDLSSGVVNVTIFPADKADEILDPFLEPDYSSAPPAGLTLSVAGSTVSIAGEPAGNVLVGLLVDGAPYLYAATSDDTPSSIAANLCLAISGSRNASLSGSSITVPGAASIIPKVGQEGTVTRILRRQCKDILVVCWCPTPSLRDQTCAMLNISLSNRTFLPLPDGSSFRLRYKSTKAYDQSQNALLFRRDLTYTCEFSTVSRTAAPVMLFGDLIANSNTSFR